MAAPLMFNSRTAQVSCDYADTVRFHPPGGTLSSRDWQNLADIAKQLGDGNIRLIPGSAAEVHGLTSTRKLLDFLADRPISSGNIPLVASPLSPAARAAAYALDKRLAEDFSHGNPLPGLLVAIDGGSGDVVAQRPRIGAIWRDQGQGYELIEAGEPAGAVVTAEGLPARLESLIREVAPRHSTGEARPVAAVSPARGHLPIGWLPDEARPGRVSLGAGIAGGKLPAEIAGLLSHLDVDISITPWRGVVFHDLDEADAEVILKVLAPRGFIFDIDSPLLSG